MFLKELICLFGFGTTILGVSGLALKINKFEHNYLLNNQLFLTLPSYKKLNLKIGSDFYFFGEQDHEKVLRISNIENTNLNEKENFQNNALVKISFLNLNEQSLSKNTLIKYYLESKSLWANLIN